MLAVHTECGLLTFYVKITFDNLVELETIVVNARLWRLAATLKVNIRCLSPRDWTVFENQPPRGLKFNVTDFCNANCSFCAYRYTKPEGVMSLDIYEDALRQYVNMGGTTIGFNPLVGEPLLDPFIFKRLKIASTYSTLEKIYFFTNGIFLAKDDNARKLIDSGVDEIHVSIAAFEKEKFVQIEGTNKYEDTISGISQLLKTNNEQGKPVDIHIELRGSNKGTLKTPDFAKFVLPFVDDSFIRNNIHFLKLFTRWGGLITANDVPAGKSLLPTFPMKLRPCARMFNAVILPDGDVRICDCQIGKKGKHDELVIGSIKKNSLNDIWNGPYVREIRRTLCSSNQPDVCKECGVYTPV